MINYFKQRPILSAIRIFFIYLLLNITTLCATTTTDIDTFLRNKSQTDQLRILEDTIEYSNNNKRVIECAVRYYELVKSDKNTLLPLNALYNLGKAYWINIDYNNSVRYFYQSLEVARNNRDTLKQINSAIYLGLIYGRLKEWEMVQRFYQNAYNLSHSYNNYFYTASTCWNMAFVCNNTNRHKEALKYGYEALFYLQRSTFETDYLKHFGYGLAYYYITDTFTWLEQADSAMYYSRLCIAENTKINNMDMIAHAYNNLASAFYLKKQFKESIASAQYSLNLSSTAHNLESSSWSCLRLCESYEALKMYDSAYKYRTLQVKWKDSLNTIDTRVLSSKLELQNRDQVYAKEKELSEQKFNFAVIISLVVVVSLIFISILLYSRYRLKSKLHQQVAELNSTKDKFFTIISHDLKTPIASFNNLSGIVADYYADLSEYEKMKHLKSLKNSSAHILTLLNNLLTWARLQTERITAHPENVHVRSTVENEVENQKQFAEKKQIHIEMFAPADMYVYADADMLRTVIRNIVSNAVKFTPEKGRITISASDYGEYVKFDITDTGIGISKENQAILFAVDTKLSTLGTSNERGTGLGLHLCKEFVERNNGTLWFESELGKGSTFTFTVPRTNQ